MSHEVSEHAPAHTPDSPAPSVTRADTTSRLSGLEIALLSEWFEETGGAEQVLLATRQALPTADTYVLWSDVDLDQHPGMRESWLAHTPVRGRKALALPLIPLVWRTQTRKRYDAVLSLSHALNHTARLPVNPGGVHLAYVHTPARYIWLPEVDARRIGWGQRTAVRAIKQLERASSRHVTSYAANSHAVRRRIEMFWHRDARVIHPPCRVEWFASAPIQQQNQNRDYLLGYGRWVPYKRFDFMIEVAECAELPLVIAGGGPEEGRLRARAAASSAEVTFEVQPSDERIRELAWGARALLSPAHEDFGIAAVEAQACETPVVGLSQGGLVDIVIDGHTGHLIPELDPRLFAENIQALGRLPQVSIRANATRFATEIFVSKVLEWIEECAYSTRLSPVA